MMNKKLKATLWIVGIIALLLVIGRVTANTLTLSKIRDRQQDYVLPDSLKREIDKRAYFGDGEVMAAMHYSIEYTAKKVRVCPKERH
jgi:hypothetical protein